jgi:hypothetical protein
VRRALRLLASVAAIASVLGAGPAQAFKNIEGCDILAFAAASSPLPISAERWEAYRQQVAALLGDSSTKDLRGLAFALVDIEKRLLATEAGSQAYQDYLASDSCRLLDKLNARAVDALLDEAAKSTPAPVMAALRQVTQAALAQIDRIDRSARFRSNEDRTLMLAGYYCFVAGAIMSQLPPERQQSIRLADFGETVPCKDAGRTG